MPNYSSSSVISVDWAMGVEGCHLFKKRNNLLENLQVLSSITSYPPAPPPFQDFITNHISKKRTRASVSISNDRPTTDFYLPHQTPSPLLDYTNINYAKIRAKPLYNFQYHQASIWTMSPPISKSNSLPFDVDVVNQYFAKKSENQRSNNFESRPKNSANISKPFELLDKSSQIIYDVTMRHLLQLLAKSEEKNANIDSVIRGIESGDLNPEWLQCVQRLNHSLNKQFRQRPQDKIKLETYTGEHLEKLNPVEQLFIKLIRIPNYNFKLKSYQFRDESRSQLLLLNQCIERLTQGIELVLNHQHLPGILHLLCHLYNTVSNQCVPGLDLPSLLDALSSPTVKAHVTVAHVLARILNDHHPDYLTNVIDDSRLLELKTLASVKYGTIFGEIREIYAQFQQLEYEFLNLDYHHRHHELPSFIAPMFIEMKFQFEKLFKQEDIVKQGEQNLSAYFCGNNLSLESCLSIVGQLVDKLRLAHIDNGKERKKQLTSSRSRSFSLEINSSSFLSSCVQTTTRCLFQYS